MASELRAVGAGGAVTAGAVAQPAAAAVAASVEEAARLPFTCKRCGRWFKTEFNAKVHFFCATLEQNKQLRIMARLMLRLNAIEEAEAEPVEASPDQKEWAPRPKSR